MKELLIPLGNEVVSYKLTFLLLIHSGPYFFSMCIASGVKGFVQMPNIDVFILQAMAFEPATFWTYLQIPNLCSRTLPREGGGMLIY